MNVRENLPKVLHLAWAQITLAFGAGMALSYYFEPKGKFEVLHHIGIGLIVAAVVTTFWQFREFEEFFVQFSRRILVEDAYLEKLKVPALTTLRSRAGRSILKNYVNNPAYERDALGDWIDELLYSTLLPGQVSSGLYRDGFEETICIEHLTLAKALKQVGAPTDKLQPADSTTPVLKVTAVTTYRVIAPRLGDPKYSDYTVSYSGNGADMHSFPLEKRIQVRVGTTRDNAVSLDMQPADEPLGGFKYQAKPVKLQFDQKTGICPVWMESVEYRDPRHEPYVLSTMGLLTKNLTVHVYHTGTGPRLTFEGGMMASGAKEDPMHGPSSFRLRYSGWLFEDHGYYVWWWTK